ncbi:MAG: hypothetical protein ACD_79C00967G0002 [uncultured bacterium]|nr:MAG: hypothetical protein ACD_79C00967G0002 [uncultured bacterium]
MIQGKTNSIEFTAIELSGPLSLCLGPENTFLVIDEFNHEIILFDSQGKIIWRKGAFGNGAQEFNYPVDCDYGAGYFWIVDRFNSRVCAYDVNGTFIFDFGKNKNTQGALFDPFGIAVSDDVIFVSDIEHQKIKSYTIKGEFISEFGQSGPGKEYYESDFFRNQQVYKKWLSSQTRFSTIETKFFQSGFSVGNIELPKGIKIFEDKIIFADLSGRVQIFSFEGLLLKSYILNKYPQWVETYLGKIYVSKEFSNEIEIIENDKIICFAKLEHEVGKFKFVNANEIIYISPWEKKIYKERINI